MIELLKMRGPALRFAPDVFQAELLAWLNFGEPPDDDLLRYILKNDLAGVFAYIGGGADSWRLVHATLVWLANFGPPGSYGSPMLFEQWRASFDRHAPPRNKGRKTA